MVHLFQILQLELLLSGNSTSRCHRVNASFGVPSSRRKGKAGMGNLSVAEHNVVSWLADRKEAMVSLLAELVNTDSGTYDKAGVDAAGEPLRRFFRWPGLSSRSCRTPLRRHDLGHSSAPERQQSAADRPHGSPGTVFPKGEADRRPFRFTTDAPTDPESQNEVGPCHERLRHRRLRRRWPSGAPRRPRDQRRGNRLAVVATGYRGAGPRVRAVFNASRAGRRTSLSAAARAASSCGSTCSAKRRIRARTTSAASPPSRSWRERSPRSTVSPISKRASPSM